MALDATIGGDAADTYATEAQYIAYGAGYGWALEGDNEVNLRKARAYIDRSYSWPGTKVTETQALAWPRYSGLTVDGFVVDSDTIPQAIIEAQFEMAYLLQGGADPFAALEGGAIKRKREKVDVLEVETEYADGTSRDRTAFPAVDQLLADFTTGKAGQRMGSVPLVRG